MTPHDDAHLASLAKAAPPGSVLTVQEVVWTHNKPTPPTTLERLHSQPLRAVRDLTNLARKVRLAGLLASDDNAVAKPLPEAELAAAVRKLFPAQAERALAGSGEAADALFALAELLKPHLALGTVEATKPAYAVGQSFSLRSRAPVTPTPPAAAVAAPPAAALNAWSAAASAHARDAPAPLIDDDSLLDDEDRAVKKPIADDGCAPDAQGKRQPCKNCSCGLREEMEAAEGEKRAAAPAKSACGNCALGDAFRCANCPHLGKPAFEPGDEVVLDSKSLARDVPGVAEQKVATGTTGGVVMLGDDDMMDDL